MCDPVIGGALALASIGTSLVGMQQQKKAMAQQQAYEQQRLAMQQKQYKQQADGEALAMRQKITERKRIAREEFEQNRSALSGTNIDLDSPSFGAFFKSNQKAKQRDIRNLRLMGTEKQLNALYGVQQTSLASAASATAYKSSRQALTTQTIGNAFGTASGINYSGIADSFSSTKSTGTSGRKVQFG